MSIQLPEKIPSAELRAVSSRLNDQAERDPACAREAYLSAMRQVAGSVAVVTTDGVEGRHGATVTAFCSVSADPPTVLVCLRKQSRIASAVLANEVFTLNVLPAGADRIARTFAGEFDAQSRDRFEGRSLIEHERLAPAIQGALGLSCRLVRSERHASHVVVFGAVVAIEFQQLRPLIYHDGSYCAVSGSAATSDCAALVE